MGDGNQKNPSTNLSEKPEQKTADISEPSTAKPGKESGKEPDKKASSTTTKSSMKNTTTVQKSPSTANKPSKASSPKTTGLWLLCILNFLLLGGVAGAGYWYYEQQQNLDNTNEQAVLELQALLQAEVRQLQNAQSQLNENLSRSIATLQQQNVADRATIDDIERQSQNMAERVTEQMAELSGRRPSDWLLAEANYLASMAGRKLFLEKDIKTAVLMLSEADARLEELDDPSLLNVRQLIANDIAALEQLNPTSTVSVALAVGGLSEQVSNLPLVAFKLPEQTNEQRAEISNDVADWQDNLYSAWRSFIEDFIKFNEIDAPIAPYLSESQQWLIEQQLKFALSRAQTAALAEQNTLYQQNLREASLIVTEHYDFSSVEVEQFFDALQNLLQTDFSKQYPQRLRSQQSLKEITDARTRGRISGGDNQL